MNRYLSLVPATLFLIACLGIWFYAPVVDGLTGLISGMNTLSYLVYVLLLTTAVVLMPVTVMPLIPLATALMGPLPTALLSIVGWTLGGVIAFLISRLIGRPFLKHFISLEKIDALAAQFPSDTRFLMIVLLRMTLPVDVASYALGLTTSIGVLEYTAATFVGVIWFSFAFAYLGDALLTGNMPLLIEISGASLLVFITGWYLLRQSKLKSKNEIKRSL